MMRLPSIVLTALLLTFASQWACADATSKKWNVIVMLIDDWGWTDAHCFGSKLYQTPNMDALAQRGMKFTSGYAACTVCSPTRGAMMTGMYPARTHLTDWIPGSRRVKNAKLNVPSWTQKLELKYTTIAETMRDAGYHTAHIGKWHLTPRSSELHDVQPYDPGQQGFEINIAGNQWGQPGSYYWPYKRGKPDNALLNHTRHFPPNTPKGQYLTDMLADQVTGLIERWKDEPFYMYYATYAVHTPIQGRKDLVEKYDKLVDPNMAQHNAHYAAMVDNVDIALGQVVATLNRLGIADRTVIILTGDNGGLTAYHDGPTNNAPLRAGKGSAYEGGVRVPTVVYWPGVTLPGSISDEPVITNDIYPTVLDIADIHKDPRVEFNATDDGMSWLPLLKDPNAQLDRDAIFWHYPHYHPGGAVPYAAIRARDWRLIEFYQNPHVELYNLDDDISEKHNLAAGKPEVTKKLIARLHEWQKSVDAQFAIPKK